EPLIGCGQTTLAFRPRQPFHFDPTARASNPPRGVHEENGQRPQGHELVAPLRQPVVARAGPPASRADRPAPGPRADGDVQPLGRLAKNYLPVDEALVPLDPMEDRFRASRSAASLDLLERAGVLAPSGFVGIDLDEGRIEDFRQRRPDLKWLAGNLYEVLDC